MGIASTSRVAAGQCGHVQICGAVCYPKLQADIWQHKKNEKMDRYGQMTYGAFLVKYGQMPKNSQAKQLPTQIDDDEHLCFEACLCHQEAWSVHHAHSDPFSLHLLFFWHHKNGGFILCRCDCRGLELSRAKSVAPEAPRPFHHPCAGESLSQRLLRTARHPLKVGRSKLTQSELQKMAFFLICVPVRWEFIASSGRGATFGLCHLRFVEEKSFAGV